MSDTEYEGEVTTPKMMQVCVDGWIKDITHGIMALKNIQSCRKATYISPAQRDEMNKWVFELETALHELREYDQKTACTPRW
jgi:hypothetical protein